MTAMGAGRLSPEEGLDVGEFVIAMRCNGASWKEIEEILGMRRVQLWRYLRRVKETISPPEETSSLLNVA